MLVDSHCHLDFPAFAEDFDQVLARARDAGVGCMWTIGTHVTRFDKVLAIAEAHDDVYCTVGIHPHEAAKEPEVDADRLIALADHPKVVGFGETGLDYFYEHSPREAQKRSFAVHIEAARRANLPVVIHTRDAEVDTIEILEREAEKGAFSGLVHCFSGGDDLAKAALDCGLYISISGVVTFKKADALRETIRSVPVENLLVETDAPYLAPVPRRGKRNEPAFVAHTAARVAEIAGQTPDAFAETTTDNFFRLFAKAQRPCA